ncbi:MAG: 4'-phosphopantetheinyl transferase superfamily protein [Paracoccaceae bacterium]
MVLDFTPLTVLHDALARVLPDGVALACTDPGAPEEEGALFAIEAAAVARAVPARRAEFAAGRLAAHRALAGLGRLPEPVAMGPDRAPVWPDGVAGSISHCEGACVALAAEAARFPSLAVDLEPDADLPEDLWPLICREDERAWLESLPEAERGRAARLIFSAKECAFKLQYPLTRRMLDFSAVAVAIEPGRGRFRVRFPDDLGAALPQLAGPGRFGRAAGFVYCLMFAV